MSNNYSGSSTNVGVDVKTGDTGSTVRVETSTGQRFMKALKYGLGIGAVGILGFWLYKRNKGEPEYLTD